MHHKIKSKVEIYQKHIQTFLGQRSTTEYKAFDHQPPPRKNMDTGTITIWKPIKRFLSTN